MSSLYTEKDCTRLSGEVSRLHSTGALHDSGRIIHSSFFRLLNQKTQLFPISQHAITRNRLTHTLEVAEIAIRIASHINSKYKYFRKNQISHGIINAIALSHDIGHPPFGHSGEMVLSKLLEGHGGYESNAQNIRALADLEERFTRNSYKRADYGLNLTYRTIAGVVKYDRPLEISQNEYDSLDDNQRNLYKVIKKKSTLYGEKKVYASRKGYYKEDQALVSNIKKHVNADPGKPLYTIECAIMDIADDIAYSTYDFEDSMIIGMFHPMDIFTIPNIEIAKEVRNDVNAELITSGYEGVSLTIKDIKKILQGLSGGVESLLYHSYNVETTEDRIDFLTQGYLTSKKFREDRRFRRLFSEYLIQSAIESIRVAEPGRYPASTSIWVDEKKWLEILILKSLNYHRVIRSSQLKIFDRKVNAIIKTVFKAIVDGALDDMINPRLILDQKSKLKPNYNKYRKAADVIYGLSEADVTSIYRALKNGEEQKISPGAFLW